MSFRLPEPDELLLPRSPLALVVCQTRFEEVPAVSDARTMLRVQEALGGRDGEYPRTEKNTAQTINVPVSGSHVQPLMALQQAGWRLASDAGEMAVALMPDHFSLETTAYQGWDDFRARFVRLLRAVAEHIDPVLEQRVGLRYINRLTEPVVSHPGRWAEYIASELLGPALHARLGPAIRASQQQIDFDPEGGTQCSMRHGFFRDPSRQGAVTYLLDFDVYREGTRPFDQAAILEAVDTFHHLVLQLFQQSITPAMHRFLAASNE